jgi:hypothetical protein
VVCVLTNHLWFRLFARKLMHCVVCGAQTTDSENIIKILKIRYLDVSRITQF